MRKAVLSRPPMSVETKQKCHTRGKAITVILLSNNYIVGKYKDIFSSNKYINCSDKNYKTCYKRK